MARFEPRGGDVAVFTDEGLYLGLARPNGRPLSSADALAQLGFEATGDGELRRLPDQALAAALDEARALNAATAAMRAEIEEARQELRATREQQQEVSDGTSTQEQLGDGTPPAVDPA